MAENAATIPPSPGACRAKRRPPPPAARPATGAGGSSPPRGRPPLPAANVLRVSDLLQVTDDGLFCPLGGFHVDPWRPVRRAVITHAHGDHARPGSAEYWCAEPGLGVANRRLGADARIHAIPYEQAFDIGGVRVSFHPAGH